MTPIGKQLGLSREISCLGDVIAKRLLEIARIKLGSTKGAAILEGQNARLLAPYATTAFRLYSCVTEPDPSR